MYYRLYCKQRNIEFKDVKKLCKKRQGIKCKLGKSFEKQICDVFDVLNFECFVNLTKIIYKENNNNIFDYSQPITMKQFYTFKWQIHHQLMDKFKNAKYGDLYHSDTFNNCFCLDVAPSGFRRNDNGNLRLSLVLLRLPSRIKTITIRMVLKCNNYDIRFEDIFEFNYKQTAHGWPSKLFLHSWLIKKSEERLCFDIDLEIIHVTNIYGVNVKKCNWNQYGIENEQQQQQKKHIHQDPNDYELNWNITGDSLIQFKNTKNGEEFGTVPFVINDIWFDVILYPNGRNEDDLGKIRFVLCLFDPGNQFNSITLYVHLWCKQTLSEFKRTITYHREYNKQLNISWYGDTLSLNEIKNNNKLNMLQFGCYVEILNIKYNYIPCITNNELPILCSKYKDYYKDVMIHQHFEYEWKLDNDLLNKFKTAKCGQSFCSKEIDNCWILGIYPNGININEGNEENEGNVILWLQCIRLPRFVLKLEIEVILKTDEEEIKFKTKFSYNRNIKCILDDNDFIISSNVYLIIDIVKVYSVTGEIELFDWERCGIWTTEIV